jgi:hypothetical protein
MQDQQQKLYKTHTHTMRHDPRPLRSSLLHNCKNNRKMRERTTTLTTFACTKAIAIALRERERERERENNNNNNKGKQNKTNTHSKLNVRTRKITCTKPHTLASRETWNRMTLDFNYAYKEHEIIVTISQTTGL